jgi:hypothetical protein
VNTGQVEIVSVKPLVSGVRVISLLLGGKGSEEKVSGRKIGDHLLGEKQ